MIVIKLLWLRALSSEMQGKHSFRQRSTFPSNGDYCNKDELNNNRKTQFNRVGQSAIIDQGACQ